MLICHFGQAQQRQGKSLRLFWLKYPDIYFVFQLKSLPTTNLLYASEWKYRLFFLRILENDSIAYLKNDVSHRCQNLLYKKCGH